jgi:hypothetical protein
METLVAGKRSAFFQDNVRCRFGTRMPLLRLAYTTQFLIALIAIFVLWGQVGGQSHLELVPWYLKLVFGTGAAFAAVKATAAAVGPERSWNGRSLRWLGVAIALLICCGLASYYAHLNEETDEEDQPDAGSVTSAVRPRSSPLEPGLSIRARSDSVRGSDVAAHRSRARQQAASERPAAHYFCAIAGEWNGLTKDVSAVRGRQSPVGQ